MSTPGPSLRTTDGSNHKVITAEGKERSRFAITMYCGIALLALIGLYAIQLLTGKDAHDLLALIGTAFGLLVGRLSARGD